MQIKAATKDELALLIHGLRSVHVHDMQETQKKLLRQLENELTSRYQLRLKQPDELRFKDSISAFAKPVTEDQPTG